jgi:hypothetical protein
MSKVKHTGEVEHHQLDDMITVADERVLSAKRTASEFNTESHVDILEMHVLVPDTEQEIRTGCGARGR